MDNGYADNNVNTPENIENSGGLSRWLVITIIVSVVAIVVALVVFALKYLAKRNRDTGAIIREVATSITDDVDNSGVVDELLDVAIRAATERAQLEANLETASQLYARGETTAETVRQAVLSSEASKLAADRKNTEAASALADLRRKELAAADQAVLAATQESAKLSSQYEQLADDIVAEKLAAAYAVLEEVIKKRQLADAEYNAAVATRRQAELSAQKRLKDSNDQKRGIIGRANARFREIAEKIKNARLNPGKQGDASIPGDVSLSSSKQTRFPPAPSPKQGDASIPGDVSLSSSKQTRFPPVPAPNGGKPPGAPKGAPKPVPAPVRPPTALERKYPHWGFGANEGLRCLNNDSTGCNTGYVNGQLVDLNPDTNVNSPPAPPSPKPAPVSNVISTLDLRKLTKGGGSWNIKKYNLKKSNITQFNGEDVIRCFYGKNSGTRLDPGVGGFNFEAIPDNMNRDEITFSWEVYYPRGFQFARGGKFGGVGIGYGAASGGNYSTTGASNRVMWQVNGGVIAYIYPPSGLWQKVPGLDAKGFGSGFFGNQFAKTLKTDAWNSISIGTKLNTIKKGVPQADGETYVIVNGNKQVLKGINWRKSEDLKISKFDIGTFFGGPLPSPVDQVAYFKNFQMLKY